MHSQRIIAAVASLSLATTTHAPSTRGAATRVEPAPQRAPGRVKFQECSGNACEAIRITYEGGCNYVENVGGRPLLFEADLVWSGRLHKELAPGEWWQIGLAGRCASYRLPVRATWL